MTENSPSFHSADIEQVDDNEKIDSVVPLKFVHPKQTIEKLLLFYEAAQRLNEVYSTLPVVERAPAKLIVKVRPAVASGNLGWQDIFENAEKGTAAVTFPNLSEQRFELLALRFRPFFMKKEDTHFPTLLSLLAHLNEGLRDWTGGYSSRWERAVFWGGMGIDLRDNGVVVTADKLITVGFYSRYFHLTKESREKAAVYEAKLGSDRYWLALVSSVWQRSGIVVECAKSLRPVLIAQGYATEERLAQMERGTPRPTQTEVTLRIPASRVLFKSNV